MISYHGSLHAVDIAVDIVVLFSAMLFIVESMLFPSVSTSTPAA